MTEKNSGFRIKKRLIVIRCITTSKIVVVTPVRTSSTTQPPLVHPHPPFKALAYVDPILLDRIDST